MNTVERLEIVEAYTSTGGFEVFHYTGDDGWPAAAVFDVVVARTADGREFAFPNGQRHIDEEDGFTYYHPRYDLNSTLARVIKRGSIDPTLWVEMVQDETFEERFAPFGSAWQEEQNARLNGDY